MQIATNNLDKQFRSGASTIYGVVLNDSASLDALGEQLEQAPYKQPPSAPVLYIKPRNTVVGDSAKVELPRGEGEVEIGATIGLVAKKTMTRVSADDALAYLAGALLVADLSLPHDSYYRPAVREKCFDGACPVASPLIPLSALSFDDSLEISIIVNGEEISHRKLNQQIRSVSRLLADVTEFMTLRPGDMLLIGVQYQAPRASAGDLVQVVLGDISELNFTLAKSGGEL